MLQKTFAAGSASGDTPANYLAKFKKVIKAATKEGYFRYNPVEDVKAKYNPSKYLKGNLEAEGYIKLLDAPCLNQEVKEADVQELFCRDYHTGQSQRLLLISFTPEDRGLASIHIHDFIAVVCGHCSVMKFC